MNNITVQDIQDIAVQCVTDFYNSQMPLNVGLSKQASLRNLNSDQLKRAVEATNTLAYLKSLQVSGDRTVEFPLADYGQVMKAASMPSGFEVPEFAGFESAGPLETMSKSASLAEPEPAFGMTPVESLVLLTKQAAANSRALAEAEEHTMVVERRLIKAATELAKDPKGSLHLSAVVKDRGEFTKLATLLPGFTYVDYASELPAMASAKPALEFVQLVKEAQDLVAEVKTRRDLQARSAVFESGLRKEAGLMSGMGHMVGATVSAPFKYIGSKIKGAVTSGAKVAGNSIHNVAAKAVGATPPPVTPAMNAAKTNWKSFAKGVGFTASAGFGALALSPSGDESRGTTGDVWNDLQGQNRN